ncbi:unnamed protein product, partial [Phaeothamnion confervicola]
AAVTIAGEIARLATPSGSEKPAASMSGSHLSKDFFELVKAIGESKSKQEEDRIIMEEVSVLKRKMPEATVGRKKMKEFLVRVIYVEMLGHDASFGYIKAIELTASQNLIQKRVGYLCSALTLSPEHEFRFMLINQLQRDIKSPNFLEACAGLGAICKLVTADMIPAVLPDVAALLGHDRELVRKKAVMVLHRLHQLDKESISHLGDAVRRTLCDKDPSVMGAALCLLSDMIRDRPGAYKDLVPSFVSILKQITEHRLPRDYDYHRMPAPWIQLRLLQILAMLGRADQAASEGMYEVLMDVIRRADTGINVGYAIVYECVRTVTAIYPNAALLDAAAASISRFISSDNHNLKYVGVTGLAAIVREHPSYAADHQLAVIDCLEDPDETLKRKTLDLLYSMTNPVNVEFITDKLLAFLADASDAFWREDLVKRITQCAERFAPSNSWYVGVMTRVFELAGELVKPEVATNLMQLVADGSGADDDEAADEELRRDAAETYARLLQRPALPDLLVQTMGWVLGEYGFLCESVTPPELLTGLCALADRRFKDPWTRGYIVTAVMKVAAQQHAAAATGMAAVVAVGGTVPLPAAAAELLERFSRSSQADLRQRCLELSALRRHPAVAAEVLPVDASCEDVEADESLSFLDGIVAEALARGAVKYSPPADVDPDDDDNMDGAAVGGGSPAFNITPYAKPERPTGPVSILTMDANGSGPSGSASAGGGIGGGALTVLKLKPTAVVWGRPKPAAAAAAVPGMGVPTTGPAGAGQKAGFSATAPGAGGISAAGSAWGRPAAGGALSPFAPVQAGAGAKTTEQLEKERLAAQLFGGMSSGSTGAAPARYGAGRSAGGTGARQGSRGPASPQTSRAPAATAMTTTMPAASPTTLSPAVSQGPLAGATGTATPPLAPSLIQTSPPRGSPATPPAAAPLDLLDMSFTPTRARSPAGAAAGPPSASGSPATPPGASLLLDPFDPLASLAGQSRSRSGSATAAAVTAGASPTNERAAGTTGAPALLLSMDGDVGVMLGPGGGVGGGEAPAAAAATAAGFSFGGRAMAPLRITTAEFGQRWMQSKCEKRLPGCAVAPAAATLQGLMDRLAGRMALHPVEVINKTSEGICAGAVHGGESVLVHCKLWPGGRADMTVRTAAPALSAAAAERVQQVVA